MVKPIGSVYGVIYLLIYHKNQPFNVSKCTFVPWILRETSSHGCVSSEVRQFPAYVRGLRGDQADGVEVESDLWKLGGKCR